MAVVGRRVSEQILERPVAGAAARQMAGRVRVGVAEPGQHDASGRVELSRARRPRQAGTDGGDAVGLDQHVRAPQHRRRAGEHPGAANDERHHFFSGSRSFV